MNNSPTFEQLKPDLISMGFAFYGESSPDAADPERTILRIVQLAERERKTFLMLLAWLEKVRELVHVERLKTLSRELDPTFMPVLGAVALKQFRAGDRRFSSIVTLAHQTSDGRSSDLAFEADPYSTSKRGLDQEFLEFGIRTPLIAPSDEKKILTWDGILHKNAWLRMRALMGANFRADMAYVMTAKRAKNPYQAAKLLSCNMETAWRLWRTLEQAPDLAKLAG
jgi:hypothetical protein